MLQGDKVVQSISFQLERIRKVKHHFDVVAIIRGGGGDVGLSVYNDYHLAKQVALFPIPVITGIGHATNETVTEMVSFSNAITPTKLAQFLLQAFHDFSVPVHDAEKQLLERSTRLLNQEALRFESEVKLFRSVTENILSSNRNFVKAMGNQLFSHSRFAFRNHREKLKAANVNLAREVNRNCIKDKEELTSIANTIRKDISSQLVRSASIVSQLKMRLQSFSVLNLKNNSIELNSIGKNIANMDPVNVLRRGYSITQHNGRSVTSVSGIKTGDIIQTRVFEGNITSIVQSTSKPENT